MTAAGKKPGWAFWTTLVLVGVPVLYVASFGPACWIVSRTPEQCFQSEVYLPIGWMISHSPSWIGGALKAYAAVGVPSGSRIYVDDGNVDGGGTSVIEIP